MLSTMQAVFRTYSELPVAQGYALSAILWASSLLPSHLLSTACSQTYSKTLDSKDRTEWLSRCVSNLHAISVSILLTYAVFFETSVYQGGEYELRWLCRGGLMLAVGYFMYDACIVLLNIKSITAGPSTLAHHVLVGSVIHYTLVVECPLVIIWAAGAYLTEYSTPFVNARWFLFFRHKESILYKVAGVLMALSFFLARIVYMPVLLFFLATSKHLIATIPDALTTFHYGLIGMFGHFGLYMLNVYWFNLILRGMLKMLKAMRAQKVEEKQK